MIFLVRHLYVQIFPFSKYGESFFSIFLIDNLCGSIHAIHHRRTKEDGSMPFLDILVTPQEDGTLTSKVYRKPTHADQYLQWDSHHNLACKNSVINNLTHRAKAVCSNPQLLTEGLNHLEGALTKCKYPRWAFQKVLKDQQSKKNKKKGRNTPIQKRCHIVVPYTKGLCESYKSICSKY